MLKKHQLRRLAELKLIEFLSSLKYYMKIWVRAKIFANLSGLLQITNNFAQKTDANINSTDIYLQEFFFFAYSLFTKNKDGLNEVNEEQTYISVERESQVTNQVLYWMSHAELAKWNHKIRRYVKKMPDPQT